jgi:hypothetical protein
MKSVRSCGCVCSRGSEQPYGHNCWHVVVAVSLVVVGPVAFMFLCLTRNMVGKLAQAGFGDNFCEQVERKDWDDNKDVFDKIYLSAKHN